MVVTYEGHLGGYILIAENEKDVKDINEYRSLTNE